MRLYHELAEHYFSIENVHRDLDDDISLIRSLIFTRKTPALLDLGCGTGEHLDKLTKFGITCTGLDNSSDMLEVAEKRHSSKINFIKQDIRSFDFYEEFDMIVSLFGSFDYLLNDEDVNKAFWNTWKSMKPGGIGLFEIWNSLPVKKIQEKPISRVSTIKSNETVVERERGFHIINHPQKTIVEVNYRYHIHDKSGSHVLEDQHVMRAYNLEEISGFIKENGFKIKSLFSNSVRAPFNENSNKMLILFEKN